MTRPRIAIDTCALLDLFTNENPDFAAAAQHLLDGHGKRHDVLLPALVVAELGGAGPIRGNDLSREVRRSRIERVKTWIRASEFLVAELSERTARSASTLASQCQLKGGDATVLATALDWHCTKLYTRDDGILKCNERFPELLIATPPPAPVPEPDLLSELNAAH